MRNSRSHGRPPNAIERRRGGRPFVARPGSRSVGAFVAVGAFLWLAGNTAPYNPWGISSGLPLSVIAAALYLALLFPWLAPRIHGRIGAGHSGSAGAYFGEGMLWHALWGPLLIFAGPLVYLSFLVAGGAGMAAYRWLNTAS